MKPPKFFLLVGFVFEKNSNWNLKKILYNKKKTSSARKNSDKSVKW